MILRDAIAAYLCLAASCLAADFYVDIDAAGANNGSSWTDAWTNMNEVAGLNDGDTVYISAGSGGETNLYTIALFGGASLPGGNSAAITYRVGQEAGHNGGVAEFQATNANRAVYDFSNMVISGDAGDGERHFKFQDRNDLWVVNFTGTVTNGLLEYIDFGEQVYGIKVSRGSDYEISNSRIWKKVDVTRASDQAVYLGCSTSITNFGMVRFYSNEVFCGHETGNAQGEDFITSSTHGADIHHNRLIAYDDNVNISSQHQDGLQPGDMHWARIYNNYFENVGGYGIYMEVTEEGRGYSDILVYNNVAVRTHDFTSGSTAFLTGCPKSGIEADYTDILVANNLVVDYTSKVSGSSWAISLSECTGFPTFTNVRFLNNISINTGTIALNEKEGILATNNVVVEIASGTNFVEYVEYGASNNNYNLVAESDWVGAGTNLNAYFTTDRNGTVRGEVWDIGPYEYDAGLPDTVDPTLTTATVAENGTTLTLVYSEAVSQGAGYSDAQITLEASTTGGSIGVTYVSGDGTAAHTYTIASEIQIDETVTLDFDGSTADSLEDAAGNDLATIITRAVDNDSTQGTDVTAPTLSTATIGTDGTTLTLEFSEAVTQGSGYADAQITVDASTTGAGLAVTYSSGDGTATHVYTVASEIQSGETVTLDFDGTADSLEDAAGNDLAAIVDRSVTNNSSQGEGGGGGDTWPDVPDDPPGRFWMGVP